KETKEDLLAELGHLEPVLRHLSDTGESLVPGLVSAASYPFPIEGADTIKGDFANVIFKMQIKLTPISEGGLIPSTLQDVVRLCRSLPTAPICSPAGDAIDQLCSLLGSLPLCDQNSSAAVAAALENAEKGAGGSKNAPTSPTTPPSSAGGGSAGNGSSGALVQLIGGLLGGGKS
ncbi:MAG: phospholipid/cholesterol/gamma-HCH transport system substrate-binding protein, partial [Nocardioidaceae bacterium]|nr:phospholipid/cholesterol/gamma-HCH transport system substrate-binding protein [Nocardioidaceae bacterium]